MVLRQATKNISWPIAFSAFFTFCIIYILNLENFFIFKMIISGLNVNFPLPVVFLSALFIFIYAYSRLVNKKVLDALFLILPLAIFWQLSFFLIDMLGVDPWKNGKNVFTCYSRLYLTLTLSFCLSLSCKLKRYLAPIQQKMLVAVPAAAFISLLIYQIFKIHQHVYLLSLPLACLMFYFSRKTRRKISRIDKHEVLFVVLVFILAFSVRLLWGLRVISITGNQFYAASDDGITYGPNAERWVKGIGGPSAFGTFSGFIYTIFLGVIYKFFGSPNYFAAAFIQSILGGMVPVLLFYIAKRLTNTTIAGGSAVLASLGMNNIFTSTVIGMEALFIPLIYVFLFFLIKYTGDEKIKSFRYSFFTGALLGIANIVRQEVLLFPVAAASCIFMFSRKRFNPGEIFKIIAPFILGFAVILLSYCLRNYIREGRFDFKTDSASISFCLAENGVTESGVLCDMGFNPFKNPGKSLRVFVERPAVTSILFLKGTIKKGVNYLLCPNFGEMDFLTLINNSGITNALYRFPVYCQFYIYLFVLAGIAILFREKKYLLEKSLLIGYIAYTLVFYAVIYSRNARYKAVLEPLFFFLFMNAVYFIIKRFKESVLKAG